MTTELVLLLAVYALVLLGVFLGESGPLETFKKSGPVLAVKIERNISFGHRFVDGTTQQTKKWEKP